jgi:hypothetical protein
VRELAPTNSAEAPDAEPAPGEEALTSALRWGAGLAAVAALLPVKVDGGTALWPWQVADHPTGLVAAVALAAVGPALLLLSFSRQSVATRGALALGLASTVAAALLCDAEGRAALLPFVPIAWGKGGPLFLGALWLAGAAGALKAASSPAGAARALAVAALGCVGLLYSWPHRGGSLAEAVASMLWAAREAPAFAMNGLIALMPVLAIAVCAVPALRRRATRSSNLGWMVAFTPAVVMALALKASLAFHVDALALVGLRAALLWVAAPLAGAAGLRASLSSGAAARRLAPVLAVACLASAALAGFAYSQSVPPLRAWPLAPEPSWAVELYERELLGIVFAVSRSTGPRDPGELGRATAAAVARSAPVPELAAALGKLGELAKDVAGNRRALERQGDRINEAARAAGLPFYADVNVLGLPDGRKLRWLFYVKTYRIRRVRTARVGDAAYGVLWLERLDDTNVVERLLGWKKTSLPYASVILDKLSGLWLDRLLPALAFASAPGDPYADAADEVREDLEAELDAPARAALGQAVECVQEKGRSSGECEAELSAIEAPMVQVLALVVEAHELQHVIDAGKVEAPPELLRRMPGFSDDSVDAAADELSAYLAEMGRSEQPRLALGHLRAVARSPRTPEAFAGAVLLDALRHPGEEDEHLAKLPRVELRDRARAAYRQLFGQPLAVPDEIGD